MTETQKKIVIAFAEAGMNIQAAADKTFFHRNTVCWHLIRIKMKTGLDPRNFFELHKLYEIATTGEE